MKPAFRWIVLGIALGGVALLVIPRLRPPKPPPSVPQRLAPTIPTPTPEERVRYFYGVLRGGQTLELKAPREGASGLEVSVWRVIGGGALAGLGQPALEFLTSTARYPEYVASPNLLVTALQFVAVSPPAPGLFDFLEHWLDEKNCPQAVPGSDWPEEIRVHVFTALRAHLPPEAVPVCIAELARPRRAHDMRADAIDILMRLGKADVLNEAFRTLPPTPDEPWPDLRGGILERLFSMAAPAAGEQDRAQAAALEPVLEEALAGPRAVEAFTAMGTLRRLGRPGMEEALERFFAEHRGDEKTAWSALLLLAADGPLPFVREACLARIGSPDSGVGFTGAVRILATWWPEEVAKRFDEWTRARLLNPYMVLSAMLRHDREMVLRWLREEIEATEMARLLDVLRFVRGERVLELVPDVLRRVRELDAPLRPPLYQTLVALRAPGTEALLLAELGSSGKPEVRHAAAVELLNLGGGEERLAELLAEGDGAVLDALLRRAKTLGKEGVPKALVPGVLRALRTMPGEDGRRAALYVLRFRGRLDDVRDGLVEAYVHEPSRRVAQEILETITELAHR